MSARGFRSVFMVGAIASAALGCYLVSLRVASERAALQGVENKIVLAKRDIRLLETEIGTRGRLAQLERWNVKVIRLSVPSADQFVDGAFQLATLTKPERAATVDAPVVLASAQIAPRIPVISDDSGTPPPRASRPLGEMMHVASYSKPTAAEIRAAIEPRAAKPVVPAFTPTAKSKGASATPTIKPATATKPVKTAMADPLAPLSAAARKAKSGASAGSSRTASATTKDPGSH
ncbi:MAG: hypothetical protein LH465_05195 [Sphingomonas bacterium]|nr:hypothetical protein [Sphingomonas bacterium]